MTFGSHRALALAALTSLAVACGTAPSTATRDGSSGLDASHAPDVTHALEGSDAAPVEQDVVPATDTPVAPDVALPDVPQPLDAGTPVPLHCPSASGPAGAHTTKVPAEFVARAYVEAFGRMPDQGGWNYYMGYYGGAGCSPATLALLVRTFFESDEFLALPYTPRERLLALVRGTLGREPTQDDFDHLTPVYTGAPDAWCAVVEAVLAMPEFPWFSGFVCDASTPNYHRETTFPPLAIASSVTTAALQAQLDAAAPGSTVTLPEAALVMATATITVPAGVTLTTAGVAGIAARRAYARMARIVRDATYEAPVVRLRPGATLENVWVDGRRYAYATASLPDGQNVFLDASASAPSTVRWVRSDNPTGPQNVRFGGSSAAGGCAAGSVASENLVGNYSNDNRLPGARWADGIFTICEHSTIADNEVIDASDVALIAFFSMNATPQHSQFLRNAVLSAGNDAFGGLGTDPWAGGNGSCTGDCDFHGLVYDSNVLFTGPNTHFVIGIAAGTRAWAFISPHGNGTGARYTNNTSGTSRARVQLAIYISGMLDATLTGNWNGALLDYVGATSANPNTCGTGATFANTPSYASGSLQGAVHADRDNCI